MSNPIVSDLPSSIQEPNPIRAEWLQSLAQQTQDELKNVFYLINQIKDYPNYQSFCPVNKIALEKGDDTIRDPFKPALVAEYIAHHKQLHFKTDINTGILYFYNGKSWIANAEPYLEYLLQKILKEENKPVHFNNILHDLKGYTYTTIEFSRKIAVENGLLDVETQTLTDFSEKEMPFHELNVTYNPEAKCPNFEAFMSQVVNSDDLPTIQEWSGFLLLADYRFHKLLWIQGEGRNGKGVWQRTMENILGKNNIAGINLEEFDGNHRFAINQLYGKLFNPCSEPTTSKVLQTNLLKKATGQDSIKAERKGTDKRVEFTNYAKITVLANRFPKVNDQTTAFKERRLFIKFPNEFTGKNQVQNVETYWLIVNDERSGILNWMLTGLKRLLEQGFFSESLTQQETEAEFLRASDTIGAFIKEMGIFDKTLITPRNTVLESYKQYCDVLCLDAENEKKFTQRLKDTPKISVGFIRKPKQERGWKGFGLKFIDVDGVITQAVTLATLTTPFHPQTDFQKSLDNNRQEQIGVADVAAVANPEVYKERVCAKECLSYQKPECPLFFNKIDEKNLIPLKCYGFKAPNPGEEY